MSGVRTKQALASMGLASILVAYVFLLVPFTIYIGNINEFTVSFGSIARVFVPAAIFIIGLLCLVGLLLPASAYGRYVTLLATTGILLWIQGNLLVWDYGLLDGRTIDWSRDAWRGLIDVGAWTGGILLAIALYRSIGRRIINAAVFLFVLQLFIFASNWISHAPELADKSAASLRNQTPAELFRFSSQKNVVQIVADGFQSDVFEEIITSGDEALSFAAALDGFTFYRNHLGVFPYTHMSVPAILSSKIYQNHIPINQFLDSTIGGKTILNAAIDDGYEVDLAVPEGLTYMYEKGRYTNLYTVSNEQHVSDMDHESRNAAKLIDLALFRISPHFLKKHIYNDQLWLVQSSLIDKEYMGLSFFSHKAFLRRLHENMSADRQRPVYKYIHLMLSHNPMVSNEQCGYAGQVLPTVRKNVTIQAGCGLSEVLRLFEGMKKAGIYDDALIVLMSDHGAWVPPTGLKGRLLDDGESIEVMDPQMMALALPLLAIKRPGESAALHISDAPSWIVDTAATIADSMDLDAEFDGTSVFDLGENDKRARRLFLYQYKRSEWTDEYLSPIQEFTINGRGNDSSSWQYVATHLPNGVAKRNPEKGGLWQKVEVLK